MQPAGLVSSGRAPRLGGRAGAQEKKREEAAARKAELKRLAAEEEAALANAGKKKAPQKIAGPKVTPPCLPS